MKYLIVCLTIFLIACATTKYITVNSNPFGAIIEVDGVCVGRAPTTFLIKGTARSIKSYTVRAIPTDITNEIKFVKQLLALRQTTVVKDLRDEYIDMYGNPQNINKQIIKRILTYLVKNKNKGDVDELLVQYVAINSVGTQYTQSKTLWCDEIFTWRQDTLVMYFDMFLEPIPQKYEIEWK